MNYIGILFLLLSMVSNGYAQRPVPAEGEMLYRVSIVKLLANPEEYHNKKVSIKGFLHYQFEDSGIYLSEEYSNINSNENALWVSYDENVLVEPLLGGKGELKSMDRKYVTLVGYFDMNSNGHFGSYAGSITRVTRISTL